MAVPQERLRVTERPGAAVLGSQTLRVSWSSVWSGALISLGAMLLLATLGLAIGVSAADREAGTTTARALGTGAAIWAGLTLLVAVFVGGMIATRFGLIEDTPTSAVHGALVWVLSVVAVLYLATSGVSFGVNTLLGVAGPVMPAPGTTGAAGVAGAADAARTASWATFAALVISLIAAIGGAIYGGRRTALRTAGV